MDKIHIKIQNSDIPVFTIWGDSDQVVVYKDFEKRILEDDDFSKVWGNLGFIYGKQWRDWSVRSDGSYDSSIDQISNLIYEYLALFDYHQKL